MNPLKLKPCSVARSHAFEFGKSASQIILLIAWSQVNFSRPGMQPMTRAFRASALKYKNAEKQTPGRILRRPRIPVAAENHTSTEGRPK